MKRFFLRGPRFFGIPWMIAIAMFWAMVVVVAVATGDEESGSIPVTHAPAQESAHADDPNAWTPAELVQAQYPVECSNERLVYVDSVAQESVDVTWDDLDRGQLEAAQAFTDCATDWFRQNGIID